MEGKECKDQERLKMRRRKFKLLQSTAASTWWCGPRHRLGWAEMAIDVSESPSYARRSPQDFGFAPVIEKIFPIFEDK